METKLQELTDKVYKEGVAKAQNEADAIAKKAQADAEAIVEAARKEAAEIVAKAKSQAEETARNTESEIKLASGQTVGALKAAIENLITTKVTEAPLKETFADKAFIADLLRKTVDGFVAKGSTDLKVILSAEDLKALDSRIKKSFAAEMSKGLTFEAGNVKSGFKIGPKDGSYYISFAENDFQNFFKAYLRTKTAEMLFGK